MTDTGHTCSPYSMGALVEKETCSLCHPITPSFNSGRVLRKLGEQLQQVGVEYHRLHPPAPPTPEAQRASSRRTATLLAAMGMMSMAPSHR